MSGTTNLTLLREEHPSPGFSADDLFFQRVTSTGEDVAYTFAELTAAVVASQATPWEAGTYAANKLRSHGGKICVSKVNGNNAEPAGFTDSSWAVFNTLGDALEFIFEITTPFPVS